MSNDARFWDKRAEKYALRPISDPETYKKKLEITQSYLNPDSEILELGCGTGTTALRHAPFVKHILATDISPAMLEIARRKADDEGVSNVTFETRAAGDFEMAESSFDAILALNLLHLLRDPEAVISSAYRGLKPGGVFVTSTACIADMSWYFRSLVTVGCGLRVFPRISVLSRDQLRQSHIIAGFEIEQDLLPKRNAAVFMVAKKPGAGPD